MRWRPGLKAGFTTGEPWLPVGDTTGSHNVESQKQDPRSLLNLYRSLIALRRLEPALRVGSYRPEGRIGDVLAYRRRHDGREFLVLLNFGDAPEAVPLKARGKVRLSTRLDDPPEEPCDCVCLRAKEGVIVECAGGM
jgi:alpha-glucosidase